MVVAYLQSVNLHACNLMQRKTQVSWPCSFFAGGEIDDKLIPVEEVDQNWVGYDRGLDLDELARHISYHQVTYGLKKQR